MAALPAVLFVWFGFTPPFGEGIAPVTLGPRFGAHALLGKARLEVFFSRVLSTPSQATQETGKGKQQW